MNLFSVTCQAWKELKKISAEEGLIATAYEGKYGEYDRLYQMVKLFLFSPVSGLYSCPLAMTDGAAKTAVVRGFKYILLVSYSLHLCAPKGTNKVPTIYHNVL